mmetsp:Transcript_7242/g.27107  ORF Transcript_7242/g.27107 Transcript_7242/m.27107 type:complete len:142 (-) Transcript_7242:26-451(-)
MHPTIETQCFFCLPRAQVSRVLLSLINRKGTFQMKPTPKAKQCVSNPFFIFLVFLPVCGCDAFVPRALCSRSFSCTLAHSGTSNAHSPSFTGFQLKTTFYTVPCAEKYQHMPCTAAFWHEKSIVVLIANKSSIFCHTSSLV